LERIRWLHGLECLHCKGKRVMKFHAKGKTGKERSLYECVDCRYWAADSSGDLLRQYLLVKKIS
jgi:transposase-like protein